MARVFAYSDAQRYRIGANYNQLPVNQPHAAEVRNYMHEGQMRYQSNPAEHRTYTPNSFGAAGGPEADPLAGVEATWETDGELMRAAATLHLDDDDFGQAGTLYRTVFDDEQRARFLETLTGQGRAITIDEIRERFFQYWTNVDAALGEALRRTV